MALDESTNPEDHVDEAYGVKIAVEQQFTQFLDGAVINFIDSEDGSGFEIKTSGQSDCSSGCSSCGS